MFNEADLTALVITLKLAFVSTFVLLLLGTPLAWWLARTRWRLKFLLEAMIALPLVLPPTVLGFYLLLALGPNGPLGALMASLGERPVEECEGGVRPVTREVPDGPETLLPVRGTLPPAGVCPPPSPTVG